MSILPYGILGWTSHVGQTLFHQLLTAGIEPTDIGTYNSKNLQEIRGATFGTLYIACMPTTKWWTNLHPENDQAVLDTVLAALATVKADKVVLLSTVDVLQSDVQANEKSEAWADHSYGFHRRLLEIQVQSQWPTTSHILRLPALFGRGLKKNALYDLIHDNNVAFICLDSVFQWYNLAHLLRDCDTYVRLDIRVGHMLSPPISMREIVQRWFPHKMGVCVGNNSVQYNLTTSHGGCKDGSYTCTKKHILQQMGEWISWETWRKSIPIAASNIGFTMSEDTATVLHHMGITCLEIAPTKGTEWADFPAVSAQSLFYGLPITNIFQHPTVLLTHLKKLMESASVKGIRTFVFGAPQQRKLITTWIDAVDLFQQIAACAESYGITVCLEPNASAYGCTWLTTVEDVYRFVREVNHPNLRISLDSGNYCMEGDSTCLDAIALDWFGHFQVSAGHLHSRLSPHEYATAQWMVQSLWERGYTGTISYEAREPAGGLKEYCRGLGQFANLLQVAYHQSQS